MLSRVAPASPALGVAWRSGGPEGAERSVLVLDETGRLTVWNPRLGHPVQSRRVVPSSRPAPRSATEAQALVEQGEPTEAPESLFRAVGFATDGSRIALALEGFATVWDLDTLEREERYELPDEELTAIAVEATGPWVVSGDRAGRLCVWPVTDGEARQCQVVDSARGAIRHLRFDSEGRLAVGWDSTAVVGEIVEGAWVPVEPLVQRDGARLTALAFSTSGERLALGWDDGTVEGLAGDLAIPFEPVGLSTASPVVALAFGPDGDSLVAGTANGGLWIHQDAFATGWRELTGPSQEHPLLQGLGIDPSGQWLAEVDARGALHLRSLSSGAALPPLQAHGRPVTSVRWANARELWTVTPSRPSIDAWDVSENLAIVRLEGAQLAQAERAAPPSVAVASPDGRRVAVGFADGGVALWDRVALLESQGPLAVWEAHVGAVTVLRWYPSPTSDTATLWTSGEDGVVRRWQGNTGESIDDAWQVGAPITHLGFGRGGAVVALGTDTGLELRDTASGDPIDTMTTGRAVIGTRFTSDTELVVAVGDGLYSWRLGSEPEKFQGLGRGVRSFDFAPGTRDLASTQASNGAVEVWTFNDEGRLEPIHLLLRGNGDRWVACEHSGTCRRNDDGTLLLLRDRDQPFELMLPALGTTPQLEITAAPRTSEGPSGETTVEVGVRNLGPGPAAWVTLRSRDTVDEPWAQPSNVLPWLAAGEDATLRVTLAGGDEAEPGEWEVVAATAEARDGVRTVVGSAATGGSSRSSLPLTWLVGGVLLLVLLVVVNVLRRS